MFFYWDSTANPEALSLIFGLIGALFLMLFGFLLIITSSPHVALKITSKFGLLSLIIGFVWIYYPIYIERLKDPNSLMEIAILLGGAFIALLIFLYLIFSLLLGKAFATTIVEGIISSFIYDTLKIAVSIFTFGFNRFHRLWIRFIRGW